MQVAKNKAAGRVTQLVSLDEIEAVLSHQARAAVAFAGPDGPQCVPAVIRRDGGFRIGISRAERPTDAVSDRVTLLVDEGCYWFQLRAALWRGTLSSQDDDAGAGSGHEGQVWFGFEPRSAVAWDYGRLHKEPSQ